MTGKISMIVITDIASNVALCLNVIELEALTTIFKLVKEEIN